MLRIELMRKLHVAVTSLNESLVASLLAQEASPSELFNKTTALHLAVQMQQVPEKKEKALRILAMLLPKGNINQVVADRTVMNLAAHNNFWEAVLKIAEYKTDANDSGQYNSALSDAIRYCRDPELVCKLVIKLLEAGAKDNTHSKLNSFTSMHWAVENDYAFVLPLLLDKFPLNYLRVGGAAGKEKRWNVAKTPARMAYDLGKFKCFTAIAECAYLPIISGELSSLPVGAEKEKDLIFEFVRRLPAGVQKWDALNNGPDKSRLLGRLNYIKQGDYEPSEDSGTLSLYLAERKAMMREGYPGKFELKQSPQLFQTAPSQSAKMLIPRKKQPVSSSTVVVGTPKWVITDYLDGVGNADIPRSPAIPIKKPEKQTIPRRASVSMLEPEQLDEEPRARSAPERGFFARLLEPSPPNYSNHDADSIEAFNRFG